MRVAIYGRVSTGHRVEQQTIEQQIEHLTAQVATHAIEGWTLEPAHVFRDDGYSGASLARPGLDRLRDAIKSRDVDRVLVTAPDRLARNYVHQMVLLEEWTRAGCTTEFLERPMSDDPHDHLLLQIRGAVAEYERTLIAERMRRGRLAKLRAGTLLPWTRAPYAYRLSPDRPRDPRGVTLDLAEAAIVAELFAMYREPAVSLLQLSMRLDARGVPTPSGAPRWSCATVRGILRNPTYTGQVYAQRMRSRAPTHRRSATHPIGHPSCTAVSQPAARWILVAQVPAVVSQTHFEEVQAKLATNHAFAARNNTAHRYLLRALVSCGCCGLACRGMTRGRYACYICNGKRQSTYSRHVTRCSSRRAPVGQLDELVWQDLCALLSEPEPLAMAVARAHGGAWLPQELLARREALRRGRAHLQQQIERLTDAYLRAVIPLDEYERRRRELEQRVKALAEQEEQLHDDTARQHQVAELTVSLEAFRERVQRGLAQASFEQRRELVLLLIDRVVVTNANVEIRYALPTSPGSEQVRFGHLRKDYFHAPPSAVELGDLSRVDPLRQVAPQPDHALARLGRRVHSELDAPPGFGRPGQLDPLLAHCTGLAAAAGAPGSLCRQLRGAAMLAHQEAGLRGLPTQQNRSRAELPIGDPQLLRPSAGQQVGGRRALALVRVLAGQDVGDQPAVRIVDHQRVSRQRRAAVPAQGCEALLAGRQVVTVEHAQLPARQAGTTIPARGYRPQPFGAAADQCPQHRRLRAIDLVVERADRHWQRLQAPRRSVQRRAQAKGDQPHQLDHRREQQLARVLPLSVLLEYRVDPAARKGVLQRNPCHHACRRALLETLEDRVPNGTAPVLARNRKPKDGPGPTP
jgi:site-specific DNA recombinase